MTQRQLEMLESIRVEQDGDGDCDEWGNAQYRTAADKRVDPDFVAFFGSGHAHGLCNDFLFEGVLWM